MAAAWLCFFPGASGSEKADFPRKIIFLPGGSVPANHLKFYLHFPEPMERGGVFEHFKLIEVDQQGKEIGEVPEPFREVELWDETFSRLTVWLHPGRQKPGVNLNLELGPVLEPGRFYEFRVSEKWRTESGKHFNREAKFRFSTHPPDKIQPRPKDWKLTVLEKTLKIRTGDLLDPVSARKSIRVKDKTGKEVAIESMKLLGQPVKDLETPIETLIEVEFSRWKPGEYLLVVDPALEDLAGNSVARPFNVDLSKAPVSGKPEAVELGFAVPEE